LAPGVTSYAVVRQIDEDGLALGCPGACQSAKESATGRYHGQRSVFL